MTENNNFKNKFVRREISSLQKVYGKYVPDKRYIIGIVLDDIILPHPITDFIDKKYYLESGSVNSERAAADILVHFLNFVYRQLNDGNSNFLHVRGIKDLKLSHLEDYLEYCGEIGNKRDTVLRKEYYLLQFYYFIGFEKMQLKEEPEIKLVENQYSNPKRRRIKRLSANLYYKKPSKDSFDPKRIKKKDFVTQQWTNIGEKRNFRLLFIREFLLLAAKEVPDIAFAICLQIFGGLRAAECMNLSIHAVKPQNDTKYGEKGMIVEVRDRQLELFNSSQPLHNEQVKKPRDQAVLLDPLVPFLFKKHLKWLSVKKRSLKNNNKSFKEEIALFININGQAMRTHTYRSKFNKLKKMYLGMLSNTTGRYEDFKEFRNTNWSTHICRGTFTNLCLDSGFNATQTSIMRGDSSPEAMNVYTDILTATRKITQALDVITEGSIDALEELNNPELLNQWKEVMDFEKT